MKKRIVLFVGAIIISMAMGGCGKDKTSVEQTVENQVPVEESYENLQEEVPETIQEDEHSAEEEVYTPAQGDIIFSTEYTIEDYCHGLYIVSKSDQTLYGVLDSEGNELLPLTYDDIYFLNGDEVKKGIDEEVYFDVEYENTHAVYNENGEKIIDGSVSRESGEFTNPEGEGYYFVDEELQYQESRNIYFYDKSGTQIGGLNFDSIDAETVIQPFYLTNKTVIITYLATGRSSGSENRSVLYDLNANELHYFDEVVVNLFYDDVNRLAIGYLQSSENTKKFHICTIDEDLNVDYLGELDDNSDYCLNISTVKLKSKVEEEKQYDRLFRLNQGIKLYSTNGTWKLTDADGQPLYDERYFLCASGGSHYLLQNGDQQIMFINYEGKIVIPYGYVVGNEDSINYNGVELTDDNTFFGYEDAVIITNADGMSQVHYFFME